MQKWRFVNTDSQSYFQRCFESKTIRATHVLLDDFHVNILKFVSGHGSVVQPASINIVFGCKQAQQYSRIHHLGFNIAVSWSAQNAESHWSHVHITLTAEHFSFHAFYKKCGFTTRFDVLFQSLNLTKTINIFLAHFRFLKMPQIFWCCWASWMQPHPYQNLHWYPLTSSKNI